MRRVSLLTSAATILQVPGGSGEIWARGDALPELRLKAEVRYNQSLMTSAATIFQIGTKQKLLAPMGGPG